MPNSHDLSRISVLVVEDNPFMASIVKTYLREFGIHDILEASDGIDALELIRGNSPDLAIVDCNMPTLDGIEFVRFVRTATDSPNRQIPIIMVTAYSQRSRIIEARDTGVDEILAKPVSAVDLYRRLIEVLERRRPFTESKAYVGPSRRRRDVADRQGPDRRKSPEKSGTA